MEMRYDWSQPVSSLLFKVQKAGIKLIFVNDGEETTKLEGNNIAQRKEAVDVITSVDISSFNVEYNGIRGSVLIVLGDSPEDIVNDYSSNSNELMELLESVVDSYTNQWEGKKCPKVKV